MAIELSRWQQTRLYDLQNTDATAKVIGHLEGYPVIFYSGYKRSRGDTGRGNRLAILSSTGRLRGVGYDQLRRLKIQKGNCATVL